jgi:hypothetical protein
LSVLLDIFKDGRYAYYLQSGDDFMNIYICQSMLWPGTVAVAYNPCYWVGRD